MPYHFIKNAIIKTAEYSEQEPRPLNLLVQNCFFLVKNASYIDRILSACAWFHF